MDRIERKSTMDHIYIALVERGYRPDDQIIGFILTGDPTYITNQNGARRLIGKVDRHYLLCDMISSYLSAK